MKPAPKARKEAAARAAFASIRAKIERELFHTPAGKAWRRFWDIIEAAKLDQAIAAHQPTAEFLDLLIELTGDALRARNADDVMQPLVDFLEKAHRQRDREQKVQAAAKSATARGRTRATIKAIIVDELLPARTPRRNWVDLIAPRLKRKRIRISDRQIQNHLTALGYPGRATRK